MWDVAQLYGSGKIIVEAIVELSNIVSCHKLSEYASSRGLGKLMKKVLKYDKRHSPANWDCNRDYNKCQIIYASDDGIGCLEIFNHFYNLFIKKQPASPSAFISSVINKTTTSNYKQRNYKEFQMYNKKKMALKRIQDHKLKSKIRDNKINLNSLSKKKIKNILKLL